MNTHPANLSGGADEDFLDPGDPSASHLPPGRIVRAGKSRVRVALCRAKPGQRWDVIQGRNVDTKPTKTAAVRAAVKAARQAHNPGLWYVCPAPAFRSQP